MFTPNSNDDVWTVLDEFIRILLGGGPKPPSGGGF